MEVFLLPQAVEDIKEFYEPLRSEILEKLEVLLDFPNAGTAMIEEFSGYRCYVISPLVRIIYTIRDDRILIVYIRHTSRRIKKP